MKTLVVFYSRKGNTEKIAYRLAHEADADVLELDVVCDMFGVGGFVKACGASLLGRELTLFPYETDVSSYDRVIVCTPVWCGKVCAPVMEFLKRERHNVQAADYVFVSASGKVDAAKLAGELDRLLRLEHGACRTVRSILGREIAPEAADDE